MTGDELTKRLSFLRLREGGTVQHAGPCPLRVNRHTERQSMVNISCVCISIFFRTNLQFKYGAVRWRTMWAHDQIDVFMHVVCTEFSPFARLLLSLFPSQANLSLALFLFESDLLLSLHFPYSRARSLRRRKLISLRLIVVCTSTTQRDRANVLVISDWTDYPTHVPTPY